jgi:pyrroline-5-carboxylate reductase
MNTPATDAATAAAPAAPSAALSTVAFIGGGNMASALIGGLIQRGLPAARLQVVEPHAPSRARLEADFPGIRVLEASGPELAASATVVWAVKPQVLREAAAQAAPHTAGALHLSVAAGIRSDSLAAWLGSERIVRAMPNTPSLIGRGMTGLFARPAVDAADRDRIAQLVAPTGEHLWLDREPLLDAVTAVSGSGPAYVFYLIEAMAAAGVALGLAEQDAHRLAVGTVAGSAELALRSDESPAELRERVTSKGGTTHAAISSLESDGVRQSVERALRAARDRAVELGDEFGRA